MNARLRRLGRRWKEVAGDAHVSTETIRRICRDDPDQTKAETNTRAKIAEAMRFENWNALVQAYKRGDVGAGLDVIARIGAPRAADVAQQREVTDALNVLARLLEPAESDFRVRVIESMDDIKAVRIAKLFIDRIVLIDNLDEIDVALPPAPPTLPREIGEPAASKPSKSVNRTRPSKGSR